MGTACSTERLSRCTIECEERHAFTQNRVKRSYLRDSNPRSRITLDLEPDVLIIILIPLRIWHDLCHSEDPLCFENCVKTGRQLLQFQTSRKKYMKFHTMVDTFHMSNFLVYLHHYLSQKVPRSFFLLVLPRPIWEGVRSSARQTRYPPHMWRVGHQRC